MEWMASLLCILCVACLSTRMVAGSSSSEGTRFAFAFSPSYGSGSHAEMIINARETTDVTITAGHNSEVITVTVYENSSLHYDFPDYDVRANIGTEDKGILVKSTEPITIHTAATSYFTNFGPGAFIVRPFSDSSVEYYLLGYGDMHDDHGPTSFYMVVATENFTLVIVEYTEEVHDVGHEDERFILNEHQVFTGDAYQIYPSPEIDLTGSRILASKPVCVYAGNGVAFLRAPVSDPNDIYLIESVPAVSDLGTEHITFPIHYGGDGGYEVRVIAVENNTDVSIPASSYDFTLGIGEFQVVYNAATRFGFLVSCSKPCMVVQYVRNIRPGGDTGLAMGGFLAVLTPEDRVSSNLIFTVPRMIEYSNTTEAAISIITNTFPDTGLHLNDTSLTELEWEAVQFSQNWYATTEIDGGFYQLYTTEQSERFTAYLYVVLSSSIAHGFPIGYGDGMDDW